MEYNVCVVGGGMIGSSAARYLASKFLLFIVVKFGPFQQSRELMLDMLRMILTTYKVSFVFQTKIMFY